MEQDAQVFHLKPVAAAAAEGEEGVMEHVPQPRHPLPTPLCLLLPALVTWAGGFVGAVLSSGH